MYGNLNVVTDISYYALRRHELSYLFKYNEDFLAKYEHIQEELSLPAITTDNDPNIYIR